jgi:hypothetical protein
MGPGAFTLVDVRGLYSKPRSPEKDLDQLQLILERATGDPAVQSTATRTKIRNVTRRIGQDRIGRLVEDYRGGVTTIELMDRFGLSKTSVVHLLEAHGVTLRRQPLSEDEVAEVAALYERGSSLTAVQRGVDAARETIRRALIEAGVRMRGRGDSFTRT